MTQQTEAFVKGINCVYLPASDIRMSAEWYVQNLGLELLNKLDEESTQAQLRISPGQNIFLIKTEKSSNLTYIEIEGHEQCVLTLEVSNIRDLYEKLKSKNINVTEMEDNLECGLNFYVEDPDGNKLDIWGGWA